MRNGCSDCNGCSADDDRVRVHSPAVVAAYCQVTVTVPALEDVFVESLSSVITALARVAGVVEITGCSAFFDTYHFIAARNVPVEAALVEVCDISAVGFAAVFPTVSWLFWLQPLSTGKPLPNTPGFDEPKTCSLPNCRICNIENDLVLAVNKF